MSPLDGLHFQNKVHEMEPSHEVGFPITRIGLILIFLAIGFIISFVFFGGSFILGSMQNSHLSLNQKVVMVQCIQVTVTLGSLIAALALYKNSRLKPYWRLAFACFVASGSILLSDFTGDLALTLSGQALNTKTGLITLKLVEDATVIGVIILFAFITRSNPDELFLSKGRLRLGLFIGITSLLVFGVIGTASTLTSGIHPDKVREFLPVFLLISLADGFTEELLFRGLFLKKLGSFVGADWANAVMAIMFTSIHLWVQFTTSLPVFLLIVFLLGLLSGWIMQRTGSLLAPALFHAGIDMLIIEDYFAALVIV